MRKVISIVAMGVLAMLMGCGGSTTSPKGESIVPDGCTLPSCVSGIMQGCAPSGTCTVQKSGLDSNICYSNGVKQLTKININLTAPTPTIEMVMTVKKDNAVCYSLGAPWSATMDPNAPIVANFLNATGTKVATMNIDSKTRKVTITCTDGQPIVLTDKCESMMPNTSVLEGDIGTCTAGVCAP